MKAPTLPCFAGEGATALPLKGAARLRGNTEELDLPALDAHTACMQYTLRNVPAQLDEVLRARARDEGKSLNEVTLEILLVGAGLAGQPIRHRDLSDISGTWVSDPDTDEALQAQRQIDPELWR